MNKKKIGLISVVVIIIVALVAVLFLSTTPAKITVTYRSIHGFEYITSENSLSGSSFRGDATWIVVYINVTTTKDTSFNTDDLKLACNGEVLTNLRADTGSEAKINPQNSQITQGSLMYAVANKLDGPFTLVYKGSADVTLEKVS
jgi:hypothetical protein